MVMDTKTKVAVGGVIVAGVAAIGGTVYYLSKEAKAEVIVPGKTYYFDFIPGVTNQRNFIVPPGFPYNKASDIVMNLEGGLGEGTNTKIQTIFKMVNGATELFYYTGGFVPGWKGTDFPIAAGDTIIIGYVTSFSWTPM